MEKVTAFLDTVFNEPVDAVVSGFRATNDTALGQFINDGHVYNFIMRRDGEFYWNEDSEATTHVQKVASGYLDAKGIRHDSSMGLPYDVLSGYYAYRSDRIGGKDQGPKQGRCPAGKSEVRNKKGTIFCRALKKGSGSPLKAGEAFEEMSNEAPTPKKKGMGKAGKIALATALGVPLVAAGALALDPDARAAGKKMIGSVKGGIKGFGEDLEPVAKNLEDKNNELQSKVMAMSEQFSTQISEQEKAISEAKKAGKSKEEIDAMKQTLKETKAEMKRTAQAIGDEANASLKENLGIVGTSAKTRTKQAGQEIKSAGAEYLGKKKEQFMGMFKKKEKKEKD